MPSPHPDAKTVRQAIQWMLKLRHSEDPALNERIAQWRTEAAAHELAWQRVLHLDQDLDMRHVPAAGVALQTLEASHRRLERRQALKLLGTVALFGSAAWLSKDLSMVQAWSSDYATATGERRHVTLPDGSRLQLNTRSAVDVAFTRQQLAIDLKRGEVMLDCRQAGPGQAPVTLRTSTASLQTVGGRFVGHVEDDCLRVVVSEGRVFTRRQGTGLIQWLEPGGEWRVTATGAEHVAPSGIDAMAWTEGLIVGKNMLLRDFLAQISRYRRGYLTCSDDIAELRLSGVFRLQDPEQLLQLLPTTLPVQVRQLTRWWVRVEALGHA
ncbi:FecR domain-containing protein [Pseudomonas parafulva]|uniref:FecR domain-containing protein n=1 Tax=Pseudomonas parafulva TaxID=157782 RepID=UPI0007348FD0|nr:FecR domain-containing protein [Pseudomonas parafulva]KTS92074.1 peptide ABC transporter substrate-binding protein [Pseudomonas parafulva]